MADDNGDGRDNKSWMLLIAARLFNQLAQREAQHVKTNWSRESGTRNVQHLNNDHNSSSININFYTLGSKANILNRKSKKRKTVQPVVVLTSDL